MLPVLLPFVCSCNDNREDLMLQFSVAAELGDLVLGSRSVEDGANVNAWLDGGGTPLGVATAAGHVDFSQMLLANGADPMLPDSFGYTPFDYAIERFQPELVDLFIVTMGERVGPPDIMFEFFELIAAGDAAGATRAAEFLRDNHGDLSMVSLGMVLAAARGESEVLDRLLIVREDPDGPNPSGYTALAMAARFGCLDCVEVLVEDGADVNWHTSSRYETTPLMEASRDGHVAVGRYLLSRGAQVNETDVHGDHALNWAVYFGQTEFVRMLLEAGVNTAVRGQTNEFALQIAQREGHTEIVELLTR